jgi:hypothetical protein
MRVLTDDMIRRLGRAIDDAVINSEEADEHRALYREIAEGGRSLKTDLEIVAAGYGHRSDLFADAIDDAYNYRRGEIEDDTDDEDEQGDLRVSREYGKAYNEIHNLKDPA